MKIDQELSRKIAYARELLVRKKDAMQKLHAIRGGRTAAHRPPGYMEQDPLATPVFTEWMDLIEPENSNLDKLLNQALAAAPSINTSDLPRLDETNFWVWGGPTPHWGGTMADDTLIKGAEYFHARNAVYVYGATNEKTLSLHSGFNKLICQVNANCRTPGAQEGLSDAGNAEKLSELSLRFPNIVGAMLDDGTVLYNQVVLPDEYKAISQALKKHNSKLKTHCVIYVHELDQKNYSYVLPYIDVIVLWFLYKDDLVLIDEKLERCFEVFPDKPVMMGVFLHDYGASDAGTPPELLRYQLDKAREYLDAGKLAGVILLGDREIRKWPKSAKAVRNYLLNQ